MNKPSRLRRLLTVRERSLEITKSGWWFIALTLLVGFAAINSGSNLLHIIFGCQLALIIASGILSEINLHRVSVRPLLEGPLHAQLASPFRFVIRNTQSKGVLSLISVEHDESQEGSGHCTPVFLPSIPAHQDRNLSARLTLAKRGRHPFPPMVVATRFPFGLFVKRRRLRFDHTLLVYPRLRATSRPPTAVPRSGDGESVQLRAMSGEFYGLEEARDGVELRRIHWPATARLGRPILREFEAQGHEERWLTLPPGRADDPAFEREVEHVASEAVSLLRTGQQAVGLRYGDQEVLEPGLGAGHERRLLTFLALVGHERGEG